MTPRGLDHLGSVVTLVVSGIFLVGLIGVAISSRKLPETTFIEPRQVPGAVSEIAPAVMPDNTVVGESPTSVPAPATNTNVVKTVTINIRPQLGQ